MLATFLMTCHNRARAAETCALSVAKHLPNGVFAHLIAVIDNCSDDTEARLRKNWPGTTQFIHPAQEVYWAKGMRLAEQAAKKLEPDYIVWINEDTTVLSPLAPLFNPTSINIGKILVEGEGDTPKLGLIMNPTSNPTKFKKTAEGESSLGKSFNGNLVSIPKKFYTSLAIHPYSHAIADIQYGLEAHKQNIPLQEVDVTAITAAPQRPDWRRKPSMKERLQACLSPTGLPPRDWLHFCKNHGGNAWPLRFLSPYRHILIKKA